MKNRLRTIGCFFIASCLSLSLYAVPDSLVYRVKSKGGLSISFNGTHINVDDISSNEQYWFYKPADRYLFGVKSYDDSKWKVTQSDFDLKDVDSSFTGIAWLRLHYKVDKGLVGKPVVLNINHNGASEIYNDNTYITSYGTVSADLAKEAVCNPHERFFQVIVNDTMEHVLAVRYSNAHYKKYAKEFDKDEVGFSVKFLRFNQMQNLQTESGYVNLFLIGLSLFLFALAMVHLMIFAFEPSRRFNLYHSLFVISISALFLFAVLSRIIENPVTLMRISYYGGALVPTFFISILTLLYNLFQRKRKKFYYICLAVYVACIILRYVVDDYYDFFYVSLSGMVYFGTLSLSIKAIRKKFRGAKIVGLGVLGTTIFMILAVVLGIIFKNVGLLISISCIILAILSLPLSMSVYLAFDFAKANQQLVQQIVQIEDLSAKAIKEEKEKKLILENQNQLLEEQVKERTKEINQQKEIIEEKNKDITDSINYAKRIQDAILASKEIKYRIFPDAFVLFKPKDIVSGDFYWFTEKNNHRLIASCDFTGHGVPGSLMSMIGNNILNQVVNERGIISPDEILNTLHKEVKKTLKQDENTDTKDGMDVALVSFISETEIEYAGAQRPLWIISGGELKETKAVKVSIGGQNYGDEVQFIKHRFTLAKGDSVYIFSDGYADQFNNNEKKLMTRKFKEILLGIQHLSMPEQEKYLDDFIEKWKGDLEQTDDILVIGIKV